MTQSHARGGFAGSSSDEGCALKKNRIRDPQHPAHGGYMIVDKESDHPVMGHMPFPFSMTLDQVEGWLSRHVKAH